MSHQTPAKPKRSEEMRREGRQHGMVIYYREWGQSPRPNSRLANRFDSVPTTGWVTKVSPKPTNHSRYTSRCRRPRCRGCHAHPVSKARAKAKGAHKLGSHDMTMNPRLDSWRLVDAVGGAGGSSDAWDYAITPSESEVDMLSPELLMACREGDGDLGFCQVGYYETDDQEEDWCLVGVM